MGGWQPIETARGSDVVLLCEEDYVFAGYRGGVCWFDMSELTTHGDYVCANPTHWMPLPNPPAHKPSSLPTTTGKEAIA